MNFPTDLMYSKSHEWVQKISEDRVRIGLTDFAQSELGDIVFINLPAVGDSLVLDESFGDVESVKAVSDIYSPVSGEVMQVNDVLLNEPERVNADCYGAWLVEVAFTKLPPTLLNAAEYEALIQKEG